MITFWPDSKENEGLFINITIENEIGCSISSIIFDEENQSFDVAKTVYWLGAKEPTDEEKADAIIKIDQKIVELLDGLTSKI